MLIREWTPKGGILLKKGVDYTLEWPQTEDMRGGDGIGIRLTPLKHDATLSAKLHPIPSGRPEFIKETMAQVWVPAGTDVVEIPFEAFDYRHMADAHMRFIGDMQLGFTQACGRQEVMEIQEVGLCRKGMLWIDGNRESMSGDVGQRLIYTVQMRNASERVQYIALHQVRDGREILQWEFQERFVLEPGETMEIRLTTHIVEQIPRGGFERLRINILVNGRLGEAETIELYAARRPQHPFLIHTQEQWTHLQECVEETPGLYKLFYEKYLEPGRCFKVPERGDTTGYVHETTTQQGFFCAAIGYKLTGDQKLEAKLQKYMEQFLDEKKGYLTTGRTYFEFIESVDELKRGQFPECHACSAGWVQEAEYMIKMAVVYDLCYTCDWMSPKMHAKMEQCMRHYMEFEDWRLRDGDGNNFQIAEASAALFFAMLLQDQEMIERFLTGNNGLYELLGAVFSDDGGYFEGASGYMRLAAELWGQTAVACENYGINLKDMLVPAAYDQYVIHSPWAMRVEDGVDTKPFLGMKFERWETVKKPVRRLKDYFDFLCRLVTPQGILFSCNDSNEQDMRPMLELGYYLYRDKDYLSVIGEAEERELLFGRHMTEKGQKDLRTESFLSQGNGFAVLRENRDCFSQVVLKYGQHGGYHGHYDRLSLVSFIKDNETFHNQEFAWYGYDSFLFKMWVQNSPAHNMVVVDGKMQEPTPCECIYFHRGDDFSAVCAQTVSRWSDPPYGGQTPYLWKFPEEKCAEEQRYILPPREARRQGAIGEYTEPVFQRRLVILKNGICFVWDYEEAEHEHVYDCLYHPIGCISEELPKADWSSHRMDTDPYGAEQFITNCLWYETEQPSHISCCNAAPRFNFNDVIDFVRHSTIYRLDERKGVTMIGKYPQKTDNFLEKDEIQTAAFLKENSKKTIAFRQLGRKAAFVTALEIGKGSSHIEKMQMISEHEIRVEETGGKGFSICVEGMQDRQNPTLKVQVSVWKTDGMR